MASKDNEQTINQTLVGNRLLKDGGIKPNNTVQNIVKEPDNVQDKNLFVCVLGLHRSGSSCTAMILHKLGIHMGDNLGGHENKNGGGGEARRLAQICEQAVKFPSTQFSIDKNIIQKKLTGWIDERTLKAKKTKYNSWW